MPVQVLVRDLNAAQQVLPAGTSLIQGDLLRGETLEKALDGVRDVYYLVHSMGGSGPPTHFWASDRLAAQNVATRASEAGVERIIYVGGLGDDHAARSPHLDSRREVGRILGQGASRLTTLRAAIIVGAGGSSFEMVVQLVERLPILLCPEWIRTRCQPIDLRDLVAYLIACREVPETAGRSFDVGGPEVVPYYDLLNRVGRRLGRYSRIVVLPVLTPSLSSHWVGLVTDVPSTVARVLVDGMRTEVVCREQAIRSLIPLPLHSIDSAIGYALRDRPLRPNLLRRVGCAMLGTRSASRAILDLSSTASWRSS